MAEGMTESEYKDFYRNASPEVKKQLPAPEEAYPEGTTAKEKEKEEIRAGKEYAEAYYARRKRIAGRVEKGFEAAKKSGGIGGRFLSAGIGIGTAVLKGAGLVRKIKGVTHPDKLIKNRGLYLPVNTRFSPTGRIHENPMELYFGKGQSVSQEARTVKVALEQGYTVDQLEMVTGLEVPQIKRAITELARKKLINPEDIRLQ